MNHSDQIRSKSIDLHTIGAVIAAVEVQTQLVDVDDTGTGTGIGIGILSCSFIINGRDPSPSAGIVFDVFFDDGCYEEAVGAVSVSVCEYLCKRRNTGR